MQVHNRHALVFTGENGLTSNGLVALSTNLLTSLIITHGPHLRLIVLNGCKTFNAAQTILLQCPAVEYCICWTTLVHSKAATIFSSALADVLATDKYLEGNDGLTTVFKAFHGAKAAVQYWNRTFLDELVVLDRLGCPYTHLLIRKTTVPLTKNART